MKVKGNILKARIAFVKERFGQASLEKVLASLPQSDQDLLIRAVVSAGWYDFALGERLDNAIVSVLGGGDTRIFEEMGRASARENLAGVHSHFLEPRDPQKFMAKAPMVYRLYYDTGHRTWEPTGPTSGILTTFESETFSTPDCATVIGWHKEALRMVGAKNVQMVEETCRARGDEVCRYKVSWS
jgi:uncharacterized protein (TIGR02265 family)